MTTEAEHIAAVGSSKPAPSSGELRRLVEGRQHAEAAALLDGVDLFEIDAQRQYLAAVCMGAIGRHELAVDLLKCAAAAGFDAFWCAFHLGLFEMERGRLTHASYYLTLSVILEPGRTDIEPLLAKVAPDTDRGMLEAVKAGTRSESAARAACDLAAGCSSGAAALYLTIAANLDPNEPRARARLLELAPDLALDLLPTARRHLAGQVKPDVPAQDDSAAPAPRDAPTAGALRELAESGRYEQAADLLEGVDLDRELGADFEYYAAVCLGSVNKIDDAVALLKRAAAGEFSAFWCAYHLGLFEKKRGNVAHAAYYLSTALALDPHRTDLYPLLEQLAPGIDTTLARAAQVGLKAPHQRQPPSARQLERLVNSRKYAEAAGLLEGTDLSADLTPDFLYMAALCLGAGNAVALAVDLLKRAAAGGYPRFWCAYNLGLLEEKLGNSVNASCYYTVALLSDPTHTHVAERLARVAPDADIALLQEAQTGIRSGEAARGAYRRGVTKLEAGSRGAAASCFATALAFDPRHDDARSRLLELAPSISHDLLVETDMDRLAEYLREKLTAPPADEFDLERKLAWAESTFQVYANTQHPGGRSLIPALEALFHRALASRQVGLDTLCLFHDKMYFLYWYWSSSWEAMRGVSGGVMEPFAAAVRDGAIDGLPPILPRPIGGKPLRVGYLAEFALFGNPVGRGVGDMMELLSRYFSETYELVLYAWSQYDDPFLTALVEHGITVRQFDAASMTERVAAVAKAVVGDDIDILVSDMNSALPAVLFERRIAPVQIFFQNGLPYFPLANIDGVFRIEFYDPTLDGFDRDICFDLGLGAWNQRGYDYNPPVEPARIAAERARFPDAVKLIGIYGRLAKVTVEFLEMIEEILTRHPQVVALIGGTGYGDWIRDFISERGLAGRLVLVNEYVDGHLWGHMIDLFVDTSWDVTVAGREIMVKGKPIVSLRTPTHDRERVPMLLADDRATYIDLVSRLIEDPSFYETACAATRDFVAAQPDEHQYATAVHHALQAIVDRVRRRAAPSTAATGQTRSGEELAQTPLPENRIEILTEHPVALASADHRFPRGTKNDNTHHPAFVRACERIFGRKVHHLDLGCAGGGLVLDFLTSGNFSVGIEGSDYSRMHRRAAWRTIPSHLFTADVTRPFRLAKGGSALRFDVVSAWELLEHIPEGGLDGLIANIKAHLTEGGLFVASVAAFEDRDPDTGTVWHVTLKPREWWEERFRRHGLLPCESPFASEEFARGSGNYWADDWDAATRPELGFHLVVRRFPAGRTARPDAAKAARDPAADRLIYGSVLDELRSSAPSRLKEVDFGPDGKPVEIAAAGEVLYLPALHLQLWRGRVVPSEANFDPDAFDELRDNISSGAIGLPGAFGDANEIREDVCVLSNLYSNNFFHCFEELYKVTILERAGFQGRYVLSPFGDRHFPGLPPFATEFLELLGIREDRLILCREPTIFSSSWLTTAIGCLETAAYSNVFLALREQLIGATTTIAHGIGPRLYLERYPKRVVLNAEEVRECVSRYGFTTVDMATLSVAQQIAAAHHARVLLGAHGSGMLHCAFQERKSTVIECFSPNYMDFFILDILHILEHRYHQVVAMDRRAPIAYPHGADIAIDCHHLELILKQLNP